MKLVTIFLLTLVVAVGAAAGQIDIHSADFKNFTYQPYCAGDEVMAPLTVKDGEYSKETEMDGYTDRIYFVVFDVAYGDLNNDGRDEAVVLSSCNTGGTGNFSEGYVFATKAGKPSLISRIPGGDRAFGGLRAAKIENGLLIVEQNDADANDAACCPEHMLTSRYKLTGTKLVPSGVPVTSPLYRLERIAFDRGTSGKTMRIAIGERSLRRFVVGARAGQTLDVSINTDKASLRLLEDAKLTEGVNNFRALLPKTGDYTIEVQNNAGDRLELTINIKIL